MEEEEQTDQQAEDDFEDETTMVGEDDEEADEEDGEEDVMLGFASEQLRVALTPPFFPSKLGTYGQLAISRMFSLCLLLAYVCFFFVLFP